MKKIILIILTIVIRIQVPILAQQATQIEVTNAAINTLMYESDLGLYYSTDCMELYA